MASQKIFWDAWSRIFKQSMESSPSAFAVPWTAVLDLWAKTAAPAAPAAGEDFFQSIVRQGKTFLRLGEEFTKLTRNLAEGAQAGANWKDLFTAKFNELKAGFTHGSASDVNNTLRGLLPFFELPMDSWSRMFSSSSLLPGDFLRSVKPEGLSGVAGQVHERMDQFLSIPAVGYMREWQEQTQGGVRLSMDYQKALQEYLHAHGRLGVDALERLAAKVIERAEEGREINTLREVYDLWVDCGEEAYSAFVFTEEYADVYARLVNALMALKHHNQTAVDEVAGSLNLPTHQGITTLQRRQQEFRRELAGFRSLLDANVMEGMQARLKAQAEALNGATQQTLRTQGKRIEGMREKVTVLEHDVARLLKDLAALRNGTGRGGRGERIPAKKTASAVSVVAAPRLKQAARASTAQKRGKGE
ncbi:MAG: class III poly(R)-hydroxyalkanoic acid synthase subunit PhaE [Acidobacteriales bacterium]|nr:class III poly(R)-hydroxyalkanoic acid synthase subunit PhaE [Terriglobales bacterium]